MKLDNERESSNLEDRRGQGGGGGGGFPIGRAGGIGGFGLIAVVVVSLLFGVDPSVILAGLDGSGGIGGNAPATQQQQERSVASPPSDDPRVTFVSRILASTEDVWTAEFARSGRAYEAPRLVLFTGGVQSGCGAAQSAMGPFYCPNDQRVYIDLSFFREMEQRLGAPGEFARAYVIAHEVGHHVQNQLGILRTNQGQQAAGQREANAISVRTELMADCLSGFWARRAEEMRNILEDGDVESGLGAAAAVGDDRLQSRGRGQVVPESFTHGSSAQRVRAFKTGMASPAFTGCTGGRAPGSN
ncbi:MAG: Neutral zinc metallopeptidase family [Rubritepida sp.]|nr:Neutral zinc metallopeptidase family [Rubritepida sp.]